MRDFLKDYKEMKAFIVLHAMSVVSRGEAGQSTNGESPPPRVMIELDDDRES
jgi:hypothetical protein